MASTTYQINVIDRCQNGAVERKATLTTYDSPQATTVNGTTVYYTLYLHFNWPDSSTTQTTFPAYPNGASLPNYGRGFAFDLSPIFGNIVKIAFTHSQYAWQRNNSQNAQKPISSGASALSITSQPISSSFWPSINDYANLSNFARGASGTNRLVSTSDANATLNSKQIWTYYNRMSQYYLNVSYRYSNWSYPTVSYVYPFAVYGNPPNTPPEPPIIVWPASIASPTTYNHQPWFKAQCGVDADNDDQTIEYKIGDTGTYTAMNTEGLKQTQTIEKQHTTTLSNGAYTIYMRSYDGRAYSSEVSRTFYIATAVHDPTDLAVGKKIELRNLTKLKDQITTQRKYYGITNDFLTTKNIGDKITAGGGSLDELRTALSACKCPTISTMPGIGAKAAFANSINVLLTSLSNA